ncbi:protein DMP4 [Sesamum angolense]|uniref:Protein DMP4 n=1 Tax=Sesamum angolense TaxID=2727404 RepID=A0AAE1X7F8_9LAMI|nr:protein DMP4 [Sesamum angolense]
MKLNPPTTIMDLEQSPPPPPPRPRPKSVGPATFSGHPVHKTLASAANLANLLPTGTVLAFRTLIPSFSNKGTCQLSNKCLTTGLIAFCAVICFLSSFTDSFTDSDGKLYYGIATFKGLYIFNSTTDHDEQLPESGGDEDKMNNSSTMDLSKFRISLIDFVHAFVSLLVFLAFAFSDSDVQSCFFAVGGADLDVLVVNLPLAAGVFSSFLFMIFPTTRRGIGYADMPVKFKPGVARSKLIT